MLKPGWLDTQPNRLNDEFRARLARHTEGHPLFVIELLRDMWERDELIKDEQGYWVEGPNPAWETMPARVEGVIEQRINRLEPELREILTAAAVEGETFTAEVVAQVQGVDTRTLVRHLNGELEQRHRLVLEQGLRQAGGQRLSIYRFRHNLFQKYLYDSLGQVERAYQHEAVGNALEALYGNQTEEIAAQLAQHFQDAGLVEKAVSYLQQAAESATLLYAEEEAIAHLSQAIALLKMLPDTHDRTRLELDLQVAVSNALSHAYGGGTPEVERAFTRAWKLCRQVGETPHLFPVLQGLRQVYLLQANLKASQELATQLIDLAQTTRDPLLLVEAHRAMGSHLWHRVESIQGLDHLKKSFTFYDPQQHQALVQLYGVDQGLHALAKVAFVMWIVGYPGQALDTGQQALALAQKLAHPFSLAIVLFHSGWIHQFRREVAAAHEHAEKIIRLTAKYGIRYYDGWGSSLRGWALFEQGSVEEGLSQMREGLETLRAAGAQTDWFVVTPLAEAYGKAGQIEEGLMLLTDALEAVDRIDMRFWEAELYRLKGELLLKAEAKVATKESEDASPETYFLKAIEIARHQQNKSLELRATVSLARLWQTQGKISEAHQMLAKIYNWFTEGFDTKDLIEAKLLLDELQDTETPGVMEPPRPSIQSASLPTTHQDWGEAPDVSIFYGRQSEATQLKQWLVDDNCRLVGVLGMGGIGKTALVTHLAEQVKDEFEYLSWRSLRNATPLDEILADWILFLSDQQVYDLPAEIDKRISLLMDYLRQTRCLLVLDNVESILQAGEKAGHYREGYEDYGQLLQRVGESRHLSCLFVTSREKPREFGPLEGKTAPVHSLQLSNIDAEAG